MFKKIIATFMMILMFSTTVYAGDSDYILMHNGQDALVLGEITSIDAKALVISVADNIVSENTCRGGDPKKQMILETAIIRQPNDDYLERFKAGDYVLASLDKNGDDFSISRANMYKVDSLDFKTLKVEWEYLPGAASLTDFVNSGGVYNEFIYEHNTVKRVYNGVETIVYSEETEKPPEIKDNSQAMPIQENKDNKDNKENDNLVQNIDTLKSDLQTQDNEKTVETFDILYTSVIFALGLALGIAIVFFIGKKKMMR